MFPYKKRSLLQVFEQMTLAATNHGIEQRVIEIAKDLYVQLVDHCDKRGLSRASVVASCLYSALKMVGAPRKPKDVADIFHLHNAQFTKAFKDFQCILAMAKQKGLLSKSVVIPSQLSTTHGSWQRITLDVSAWAGQSLTLQFAFDSIDGSVNAFEGVYIDEIEVSTGCCAAASDCDDGNACSLDLCQPTSGGTPACVHTPKADCCNTVGD